MKICSHFSVPLLPNKYDLHQIPLQLPRPLLVSTFTWGTARKMHSFCSGDASSLARRFVDVDTKFAYNSILFSAGSRYRGGGKKWSEEYNPADCVSFYIQCQQGNFDFKAFHAVCSYLSSSLGSEYLGQSFSISLNWHKIVLPWSLRWAWQCSYIQSVSF